jgi:NAD(P)-dependent dehydrogenase (short-subunit alcohol dehydrogenase family)
MPTHSLVIGGTGMLKGVTKYLLKDFDIVSVIARNDDGFRELDDEAGKLSIKVNRLKIDYRNYQDLTNSILSALKDFGDISLVVSWIHSTAPVAPLIVAKIINHSNTRCDYYEMLGSAEAEPDDSKPGREKAFEVFENINYHKIILGYIIDKDTSRWLENNEITRGVIEAINGDYKEFIIGSVEPWSKKP